VELARREAGPEFVEPPGIGENVGRDSGTQMEKLLGALGADDLRVNVGKKLGPSTHASRIPPLFLNLR